MALTVFVTHLSKTLLCSDLSTLFQKSRTGLLSTGPDSWRRRAIVHSDAELLSIDNGLLSSDKGLSASHAFP